MDSSIDPVAVVGTSCPDQVLLGRFLVGLVSVDDATSLEDHVQHCSSCGDVLESLRSEDQLLEAVQASGRLPEHRDEHEVSSLVQLLQKLPAAAVTRSASRGDASSELAAIADPPQNADEMGRIGPYALIKLLGSGGMGIVVEAHDLELDRRVALKIMKPGMEAAAATRFVREARAAAAIEHDHVVTVYRVGEHRGTPYLAMQLLAGESLATRLERNEKLPAAEVVHIGRQIAAGLAAAHGQGVVHRDIKPDNIWLETTADSERVKLLDFGLAHVIDQQVRLTREGALAGTPAYMAPEQIQNAPVDGRADLFSLGCVLYQMATGQPPFSGASTAAILLAVTQHQPRPPIELDEAIPRPLSELILDLLDKDPVKRIGTAEQVEDRLAAIDLSKLPETPASQAELVTTSGSPPGRWSKRAVLAGVLSLASIAGSAALVAHITRGNPDPLPAGPEMAAIARGVNEPGKNTGPPLNPIGSTTGIASPRSDSAPVELAHVTPVESDPTQSEPAPSEVARSEPPRLVVPQGPPRGQQPPRRLPPPNVLVPGFSIWLYRGGLPQFPEKLAIDQDTGTLYFVRSIINQDSAQLYRIDRQTRSIECVSEDFTPDGISYRHQVVDLEFHNGYVYTCGDHGELLRIDPKTGDSAVLHVFPRFYHNPGIAALPGSNKLYFTDGAGPDGRIIEYDLAQTQAVTRVAGTPKLAWGLEYDASGKAFYFGVPNGNIEPPYPDHGLYRANVDKGTWTRVSTAAMGMTNFAIDPAGKHAYVRVLTAVNRISLEDGTWETFVSGLQRGGGQDDLAFGPSTAGSGQSLYLVEMYGRKIFEVSGWE